MAAAALALCICDLVFSASQAGKILVVPVEGSHWINIKILMMELVQKGHKLTVIRPSSSLYIDGTSEDFQVENFSMSESLKLTRKEFEEYALNWIFQQAFTKHSSSFTVAWEFIQALQTGTQMSVAFIQAIFENKEVLGRLAGADFEVVLADPYNVAGVMLAHHLKLPIVFFGRWMPTEDIHFAIAPSPLSYVPVINSRITDRMGFSDRVKNVALYCLYMAASHLLIYPTYDQLAQRYLHADIGIFEMYKRADIYLMKVDFVFEFPRPTMPNAGQGVVVFSLGTMVNKLPLPIAREIAAGLAQLKERVIWRYSGEALDTLGNNTLIVDWLPQNDLLSHPNTKVFLAHGGENGVYEALYHGVPIVGFPLFGDQYENLLRLKMRGAAIIVENTSDITARDIFSAVRSVIDDPSYSQAMKHLSALHRDTPLPPRDLAVYWTEYVMRHKGAPHLQPAANHLAWFQYYLLDVTGFLLLAVFVSSYLTIRILRAGLRICSCRGQNKHKKKRS
uniref:UDP-glucuronosyltransferase n=1 Tax=Pyxicephalus adspersus TaxID=30357 RepID=A0AAV3AXF2_PYXAD|nr:TPA: hypothetical protein GDO54_007948 [Pyxicephalus adspersus]